MAAAVALAALLGLAADAMALEEEILYSDRPSFVPSTDVVMLRRAIFETGVRVSYDREARSVAGPEFVVRYTLIRRIEFRLGMPNYRRASTDLGVVTGLDETSVGFKFQLTSSRSRFGAALLPAMTTPADPDSKGGSAPELGLTLSGPRLFGMLTGAAARQRWLDTANRGGDLFSAVLSLRRDLTTRLDIFGEWAAQIPADGDASHLLHVGYDYRLSVDGTLDVHAGLGLNDPAPDFMFGIGLTVRH